MASVASDVLTIVETLHILRDSDASDSKQFELALSHAWSLISALLEPPGDVYPLELACSVFQPFSIYVCCKKHSLPPQIEDITDDSILSFIKQTPRAVSSSRLSQIQSILKTCYVGDNEDWQYQQSRSAIIRQLSNLVDRVNESYEKAEQQLCEYIAGCLSYEFARQSKLASGLKLRSTRIDDSGIIGKENNDTNIDTERLISSFDEIDLHAKAIDPAHVNHDLLSRQEGLYSGVEEAELHFQSSDRVFSRVYFAFLQLAPRKLKISDHKSVLSCVSAMIAYYKRKVDVEAFETLENIDLTNHIFDFFCGHGSVPGAVPSGLEDIAAGVLRRQIAQTSDLTSLSTPEGEEKGEFASQKLSKAEVMSLVADFETVVSTVNEFDSHLDPSLLVAFRNFIYFAYEVFPESIVREDFALIDDVANTIAAVVEYVAYDENSGNDVLNQILQSFGDFQSTLLEPSMSSTLIMRLAASETLNSVSFARSCLRRWNRKMLLVSQLQVTYEEDFLPRQRKKALSKAFSRWKDKSAFFSQLQIESRTYHDRKHLSHYFNRRWIESMLRVIEMESEVDVLKLKRSFSSWRHKVQAHEDFELISEQNYNTASLRKVLAIWTSKFNRVLSLEQSAANVSASIGSGSDLILQKNIWVNWKQKLNETVRAGNPNTVSASEKLNTLSQKAQHFTLRKYLGIMKRCSAYHKASQAFASSRALFLQKHFLGTWKLKGELTGKEIMVNDNRMLALKKSVFTCWVDQTRTRVTADQVSRRKLLENVWRIWKLQETANRLRRLRDGAIITELFTTWRLRSRSSYTIKSNDTRLVKSAFGTWSQKLVKSVDDADTADAVNEKYTMTKALSLWQSAMATNNEMGVVADLNFQRKFFNRMCGLHSQVQALELTADDCLKQSFSTSDKLSVKAVLRTWQNAYMSRYEEEASHALEMFQLKVRETGTLGVFLGHWKMKHVKLKERKHQLEQSLLFFNNTNILKSEFLMHWVDVSREKTRMTEKSAEFHETLLYKKFLLTWYEKYVTKSSYLSDIADDMVDKREYNQMVELLRKWSLAYTKNVRRNQQTCDMFIDKWERKNLRSLFELWAHKSQKRALLAADEEHYAEANATFGSNTSPLSRKYPGSSGGSLEYLDGASYLNTPVKRQISRSPFTPFKSNTSPTRLQETNQKIKTTKIDALTKRYKLAKGETKSSRSTLQRSDSTRLPPPSSRTSPTRLPMRPPPAPRFETYDTYGPEATSSPESSSVMSADRLGREPEERIIETAKRLQKIKPVVIPQRESTPRIRYSPVSKLRERLQSRTDSFQSPTRE